MDRSDKAILVIGATGRQGAAVTRHLLADGWRVRALAHHPDSDASLALIEAGVEVFPGDLLDRDSIDRAVHGAYGVYSMQGLREGPATEETEGKNVADAAAAANVAHFVYSSVAGAEVEAGAPWVISKHHIEAHINELGLPATIWRPVTFMENYERHREEILAGHLDSPLWPETMMYLIAVDDIGRFVALSFSHPERFVGTKMAIAGDVMTVAEVAETFSARLGRPVEFRHVEMEGFATQPRPARGEQQPYRADVAACRHLIPDLATLGSWIAGGNWR